MRPFGKRSGGFKDKKGRVQRKVENSKREGKTKTDANRWGEASFQRKRKTRQMLGRGNIVELKKLVDDGQHPTRRIRWD